MYYRSPKQLMLFNHQEEIYQKLECDSNVHDIYQFIPSHLHSYTLTKLLLDLLHNSIGLDLVVGHLGLHHLPALLLLPPWPSAPQKKNITLWGGASNGPKSVPGPVPGTIRTSSWGSTNGVAGNRQFFGRSSGPRGSFRAILAPTESSRRGAADGISPGAGPLAGGLILAPPSP